MNDNLEAYQQRIETIIETHLKPTQKPVDAIVERTGYARPFVKYVVDTVDIHYKDVELLYHTVRFVADKLSGEAKAILHEDDPKPHSFKVLSGICAHLKDDAAFRIGSGQEDAATAMDFPLLARYAIVATYCASYNPPNTDRRFFFTGKDILKRKSRVGAQRGIEKFHETGPRSFDHQRALFIFLYFCKNFPEKLLQYDDEDAQLEFTAQIPLLIDAGLLQQVSAVENLDLPKYRSLCTLEFAKRVAKSINAQFDLERDYLYDFVQEF